MIGVAPVGHNVVCRRLIGVRFVTRARSSDGAKTKLFQLLRDPRTRAKQLTEVVHALQDKWFLNSPMDYTAVISAWGRRRLWNEALAMLDAMAQQGFQPDSIARSAVIGACERASRWDVAVLLLRNIREPSTIAYNATISACAKGRLWETALALVTEMRSSCVSLDMITHNALTNAFGREWALAFESLEALRGLGFADRITYNTTMTSCEKGRRWIRALRLFDEMRASCVAPDVVTYNVAVSASKHGARWEDAIRFFDDMSVHGLVPDLITYSATMSSCKQAQRWDLSLLFFRKLHDLNLQPDLTTRNVAMSACATGHLWQSALCLMKDMWDDGVRLNVTTYILAVAACGKVGYWEWVVRLMEESAHDGIEVNSNLRSAAVLACERSGRSDVAQVFAERAL